MRTFAQKPKANQQTTSARSAAPNRKQFGQRRGLNSILHLQRTIGNQAVQRLVKSGTLQAKLRIGQPGDIYEQEADRLAEQVMRMPEQPTWRPSEDEEKREEEEELVQPMPVASQILCAAVRPIP